jgi:proteasome lid subunit RPN8/RPN11
MTLYITSEALGQIRSAGEDGFPDEVCGLMLGRDGDGGRTVSALVPIVNSFEGEEQYHRYLITPADMFRAEREALRLGLDVVGVYHSHPNAPAQPSEYDRDHAAWTTWSYVIVSVAQGKAGDVRVWSLREDRTGYDEDDLAVREIDPAALH